MNYKKAAMFGLDARIALAIFGALSVITGAALYSAISNAKIVSIATDLTEFVKATEAYYLDTGVLISKRTHPRDLNTSELVENPGITGWKGPYLPANKISDAYISAGNENIESFLLLKMKDDWGSQPDFAAGTTLECGATGTCYIWATARLTNDNRLQIAESLDKYFDTTSGQTSGRLRYVISGERIYVSLNTGLIIK